MMLEDGALNSPLDDESDPLDVTDDATRSATCKHYLYEFLNGTTDANDECKAFKNAFNAADCKGGTEPVAGIQKRNRSANDDLYIDDFFENWEVRICFQSRSHASMKHLTVRCPSIPVL